jgi:hypothetical protein
VDCRARGCPRARLPSVPRVRGGVLETLRAERVVSRQSAVGQRNLASSRNAELVAQGIGVRLCGSGRDPQPPADLHVREPSRNELHDFSLALGDGRDTGWDDVRHVIEANNDPRAGRLTERRIFLLSSRTSPTRGRYRDALGARNVASAATRPERRRGSSPRARSGSPRRARPRRARRCGAADRTRRGGVSASSPDRRSRP